MNQFASPPEWASQVDVRGLAAQAAPQDPMLEVEALCRRFGDTPAVQDVGFRVVRGQVTCLLGPSGCGKSTTLRMIAGIEQPDSGRIRIDGRPMCDTGTFLPPERRPVGLMFQDFALFPHLDVAANVGFGLQGPAADRRNRVGELLERVGLSGYATKYPHELSGGEQQRVALIRALAPRPCLMLMDEPFCSLDNRLRDGVRDAALDLLRETGTTVLMVTHDPEEAMLMGHRIAVMREGRLVQEGPPQDLYDRPADRGVAAFFSDLNTLAGRVSGGRVETALGAFPAPGLIEGSRAEVVIRPQHLIPSHMDGAPARVKRARYLGRESLIETRLEPGGALMKSRVPGLVLPAQGSLIHLAVQHGAAMVFASKDS
ncbi:ATP-binding cassette domain-containing protein [Paracoccus kondratievae]|uniref:ABC transporter ATP-binding protein n=1 Tax=Paracoccus kondratievae TaxID=135740 RepID=UPI0012664AF1|nr:ABC transporter ATP-binding protein [Paracoccus kondratievae]QFQ88465.1 ATP-binding cassette domain-containing protein [Paracoccus kondratievae]